MSFHSSLVASAVWPADLVTAGVVASSGQVYAARRPRDKADRRGEVWIERLPDTPAEGTGFQHVDVHAYLVHYRYPLGNQGPGQDGAALLTHVEAKLQTIRDRYDATLPFTSTFSGMLPCEAAEESVDEDPEDDVMSGTVRVTFRVRE